jgi:hypothetical protein
MVGESGSLTGPELVAFSMINPATELADIFTAWGNDESGHDLYGARGGKADELAVWSEHGNAVVLLRQVEEALVALRTNAKVDTEPFDRYVVEWYKGVFQPDRQWTVEFRGDAADHAAVGALRTLGIVLDFGGAPTRINVVQRTSIAGCIAEALTLLDSESGEVLDSVERLYIYRLLSETRTSLEERSLTGGMDLRANIDRLNGALLGVAAQFEGLGDHESANRVAGVAGRIVQLLRGVTYDLAAVATIAGSVVSIGQAAIGAGEPPTQP